MILKQMFKSWALPTSECKKRGKYSHLDLHFINYDIWLEMIEEGCVTLRLNRGGQAV